MSTFQPLAPSYLLMPTLTQFKHAYPDIALEINGSGSLANLGNRDADVAIRVVTGKKPLPDALYGSRLCAFHTAYYIHPDLMEHGAPSAAWLLGMSGDIPTDWTPGGGIAMASTPVRFVEMQSQVAAARAAMGIVWPPCFLGDAEGSLVRVPGGPVAHTGDVWLLTHSDTRQTKRVRLLCDSLRAAMRGFAERMAGRSGHGIG